MLAKISQINYLAQGFFLCLVFSILSQSIRVPLMTEWNAEKSLFLLSVRKTQRYIFFKISNTNKDLKNPKSHFSTDNLTIPMQL